MKDLRASYTPEECRHVQQSMADGPEKIVGIKIVIQPTNGKFFWLSLILRLLSGTYKYCPLRRKSNQKLMLLSETVAQL